MEGLGFLVLPLIMIERAWLLKALCDIWVLRPEYLLPDL